MRKVPILNNFKIYQFLLIAVLASCSTLESLSDSEQSLSRTIYLGMGDSDNEDGNSDKGGFFNVNLSIGSNDDDDDDDKGIESRIRGDLSLSRMKTVQDHGLYIVSVGIRYPFSDTWTVQPYLGAGVATLSQEDIDESFGDNLRTYAKFGTDIPVTDNFRMMIQWQRFFDIPELENMYSIGVGWSF